jgi:hypothetical protein
MINSHTTQQLRDLELEILTLEAELDRLTPREAAIPAYTLADTNVIMANFNRAATLDNALITLRNAPRRQSILRRLDYLRRRYYAIRQQMMHPAAVAFAA